MDLSKAFDTVNHAILLAKLERYGIRRSYLRDRFMVVNDNGHSSERPSRERLGAGTISVVY